MAQAIEKGYSTQTEFYHGYYFKVLEGKKGRAGSPSWPDGLRSEGRNDRRLRSHCRTGEVPEHRREDFPWSATMAWSIRTVISARTSLEIAKTI